MKKIITIILSLIPMMAFGIDVCVKDNTYVVVLKHNVDGTSTPYNTTKTWKVEFNYKTITGEAACNNISGTVKTPITNLYTNAEDSGSYCWCRMWPVSALGYDSGPSSYWTLLQQYTGGTAETDCESGCTAACGSAIASNTNGFRVAIFEAMW